MSHPDWDDILQPGEEILWQGRSEGGFHRKDIRRSDVLLTVFVTVIFVGILIEARTKPASENTTILLALGSIMVTAGLLFIVGRPFLARHLRRSQFYTLTNKAGYIGQTFRGRRTLKRYKFTGPFALERGDIGSVWFSKKRRWSQYSGKPTPPIGFVHIKDPEQVHGLIMRAARGESKVIDPGATSPQLEKEHFCERPPQIEP